MSAAGDSLKAGDKDSPRLNIVFRLRGARIASENGRITERSRPVNFDDIVKSDFIPPLSVAELRVTVKNGSRAANQMFFAITMIISIIIRSEKDF